MLALSWCRGMQFCFNIWDGEKYVYTDTDKGSYVEDDAWTELLASFPAGSVALERALVISWIVPS